MGAFSGEAKNLQMNAVGPKTNPTLAAEWVAVAGQTTVTPENSAGNSKKIKKTAHGLNTGDIVVFTALTGGAGLVIGRPYYAIKVSTSEFEVAYTKALAEATTGLEFTTEIKETTTTIAKLVEHTGAKTKRIKTAFAAAVNGASEDTTPHEIEISSNVSIKWVLCFSAETAGTFMGCNEVTLKALEEGDIYRVTSGKLEENGLA